MLNFYKGKKVFLTGHTGFKGAWMSWMLLAMGAEVTGYSLPPENSRGNLFLQSKLQQHLAKSYENDLNDLETLSGAVRDSGADIVFHLAAQPLVLSSYQDPVETYRSNSQGTVHLLEAARRTPNVKTIVVITTDKCYENEEWEWPYRETDQLGGHDPYSSSKAMAEIACQSYYRSFFREKNIGLATARAGNVIGGGDFAQYRIIPDIVESIQKKQDVILRHPESIRPWQHVLDALYGYLLLGEKLSDQPDKFSTAFNFSPDSTAERFTVEKITSIFIDRFKQGNYKFDPNTRQGHEAKYLRLDSSKAHAELGWRPQLQTEAAILKTADWYDAFIKGGDVSEITANQINDYLTFLRNA